MQFFLPSIALIKLMNCYYACITAAEFLVSNYHFLTNQERQQSANTRGSIDSVMDVWKYLCVLCQRSAVSFTAFLPKRLEEAEYWNERSWNNKEWFLKWSKDLYSNIYAEPGEHGKFAISVQLSSKSTSGENFKYAWFHQLKPNNLKIPYMDLIYIWSLAMKEWWQRDKPKG